MTWRRPGPPPGGLRVCAPAPAPPRPLPRVQSVASSKPRPDPTRLPPPRPQPLLGFAGLELPRDAASLDPQTSLAPADSPAALRFLEIQAPAALFPARPTPVAALDSHGPEHTAPLSRLSALSYVCLIVQDRIAR